MTKRSGQRADVSLGATKKRAKRSVAADVGRVVPTPPTLPSRTTSSAGPNAEAESAAATLSRMIADLNEVRMRLDAIVRKLADSAVDVAESSETIDEVERLRLRLLGKVDRIRDRLVVQLSEERGARDH